MAVVAAVKAVVAEMHAHGTAIEGTQKDLQQCQNAVRTAYDELGSRTCPCTTGRCPCRCNRPSGKDPFEDNCPWGGPAKSQPRPQAHSMTPGAAAAEGLAAGPFFAGAGLAASPCPATACGAMQAPGWPAGGDGGWGRAPRDGGSGRPGRGPGGGGRGRGAASAAGPDPGGVIILGGIDVKVV